MEVISDELPVHASSFDIVDDVLYIIAVKDSQNFSKSYNFTKKEWKTLQLKYKSRFGFRFFPELENPGFDVPFQLLYKNKKKKERKEMFYYDSSDIEDSE